MRSVVVVGNGVAGTTVAATLRQLGYDGRLVLIGDEPRPPYRRTALSKEVLQGGDLPLLKPAGWYADQAVELLTGATVTSVRVGSVEVDGAALSADAVVLATGGVARTLPQAPDAHVLRTAQDAHELTPHLVPGARVLVVGAGLLGAEIAAAAVGRGCEVTVLEAAESPLSRVLPPSLGGRYADLHRSRGVDLRLGVGLTASGPGMATDTRGGRHDVDVLIVAVGQEPRTALAHDAGALVRDGVVVDSTGRTSRPGLWAVGDVAAFPDRVTGEPRRLEHWQAAMTQGAAVARGMLSVGQGWIDLPWCWSSQYGVDLQVCGDPRPGDEVAVHGDLTAVFARDGRLSGAVTIDQTADMRVLRRLLVEAPLTPLAEVDLGQTVAAASR